LLGLQTGFLGQSYQFAKGFGRYMNDTDLPKLSEFWKWNKEQEDEKKKAEELLKKDYKTTLGFNKQIGKDTQVEIKQDVGTESGLGTRVLKLSKSTEGGTVMELMQESGDKEQVTTFSETTPVTDTVTQYSQSVRTENILEGTSGESRVQGVKAKIMSGRGAVYTEDEYSQVGDSIQEGKRMGAQIQIGEFSDADFSYERLQKKDKENPSDHHVGRLEFNSYQFEKLRLHDEWEFQWTDENDKDVGQLHSVGSAEVRLNDDWTLLGRYEWSWTTNVTADQDQARFFETQTGFAYRPVEHDRFNGLIEFKQTLDEGPVTQVDKDRDAKTIERVVRGEFSYDITPKLELVEKLAMRSNEILDFGVDSETVKSMTYLSAHRLNYDINDRWGVSAEYRFLRQTLAQDATHGFLFETNYRVWDSLRVAVGYAGQDFTSDLSGSLDVRTRGVYFRVFIDAMNEVMNHMDKKKENTAEVAKQLENQMQTVSQAPGQEKDIQQIKARLEDAQAMMDKGLYDEAVDSLRQGLELHQDMKKSADKDAAMKERFNFYYDQGEMFHRHGMYPLAFENFQKAHSINPYHEGLIKMLDESREAVNSLRKLKNEIRHEQMRVLDELKNVEDSSEFAYQTIQMHYKTGRQYADHGLYEEAMSEWKKGLEIADRLTGEDNSVASNRKKTMHELDGVYQEAKQLMEAGEYIQAKELLKQGAELLKKGVDDES
jgi:tetratricopeptide (TPR) repeat protein